MSNELAKRLVACRHFRWMPGMLALDTGLRMDEFTTDSGWEGRLPDLYDPATLGCLLHLVAESYGATDAGYVKVVKDFGPVWTVYVYVHSVLGCESLQCMSGYSGRPSYAEALVEAIESASANNITNHVNDLSKAEDLLETAQEAVAKATSNLDDALIGSGFAGGVAYDAACEALGRRVPKLRE